MARSSLKVDKEMMEPAAMAAGKMLSTTDAEQVFLEGLVLQFEGAAETGTSEKERLRGGRICTDCGDGKRREKLNL